MRVEYMPLLHVQREIYEVPRGWDRFRQYLEIMQPGTDDQLTPLFVMNPMAREHVSARLDELLAIDADSIASSAVAISVQRLADVESQYKAGLVLCDDLQGGWTNRYLSEAQVRFGYTLTPQQRSRANAAADRGWIIGMLWVSDEPERERVEQTACAAIYRAAYIRQHGLPTTLRHMLVQEGLTLAFAGAHPVVLDHDELKYSREVIRPHLDTADFPVAFACLYGDTAANTVGYPSLGLSANAGYAVGYHSVQEYLRHSRQTAESALADGDSPIYL